MCMFLLEYVYGIACALKWGSSPCRSYSLLGIAHLVVGPPFKYMECAGRRHSLEAVILKEARMWL